MARHSDDLIGREIVTCHRDLPVRTVLLLLKHSSDKNAHGLRDTQRCHISVTQLQKELALYVEVHAARSRLQH